ncbi:MAG: hypothetical protein KBF88_06020 [Polyangiaceae bacterium]|nr:hypothetical protein [Polyangiaceae bacterium]
MTLSRLSSALLLACSLFGAGSLTACDGKPAPKLAQVKVDDLPAGQEWMGVYHNQIYGDLHLVEQETSVVGRWKRKDGSAWGELSGTKRGNVVHFAWKEKKYGLGGMPGGSTQGKGYFRYKIGANDIPELEGEFGLENDEIGYGRWDCIKQKNIKPDLKSIGGDMPDQSGIPAGLQ